MVIKHFFHAPTWTLTYVVYDPESRDAVVIDPVLDYDPRGVAVSTESADDLASFLEEEGLNVHYVLETHAHADHIGGVRYWAEEGTEIIAHEDFPEEQRYLEEMSAQPDMPPGWQRMPDAQRNDLLAQLQEAHAKKSEALQRMPFMCESVSRRR